MNCIQEGMDEVFPNVKDYLSIQTGSQLLTLSPSPSPMRPSSRPRNPLSPEDSEFAAGLTQALAQQPHTRVPQGVVGQVKLCQGLLGPQRGRQILTSSGCETTAIQPVEEKGWLE